MISKQLFGNRALRDWAFWQRQNYPADAQPYSIALIWDVKNVRCRWDELSRSPMVLGPELPYHHRAFVDEVERSGACDCSDSGLSYITLQRSRCVPLHMRTRHCE